jgi:hydrogenase expression/formation protein HypC
MRIVELTNGEGVGEYKGVTRKINLSLLEDVKTGDYVILHAGFAIQKLDEQEALETLRLFEEMGGKDEESRKPWEP